MQPVTTALEGLRGQRVYLDANVVIHYLHGEGPKADSAAAILEAASRGEFIAVTGELAVAEVMVGPYRTGDPLVIRAARAFFRQPRLLTVVEHSRQAFDDAAMLRGTLDLPLIDALHLATAADTGCTALVSNDRRMRPALGVEISPLP